MTKPETKWPPRTSATGTKRRPASRRRTAASTLYRSIRLRTKKAVSVSSIRINRRCSGSLLEQVMISLQVFYEGRVQGVGFRFTVRHIAKGFDVTGWVRNLPDGRVELQATGEENEVRAFVDRIADSELHSLIRTQTENKLTEAVASRGFEIHHD